MPIYEQKAQKEKKKSTINVFTRFKNEIEHYLIEEIELHDNTNTKNKCKKPSLSIEELIRATKS